MPHPVLLAKLLGVDRILTTCKSQKIQYIENKNRCFNINIGKSIFYMLFVYFFAFFMDSFDF